MTALLLLATISCFTVNAASFDIISEERSTNVPQVNLANDTTALATSSPSSEAPTSSEAFTSSSPLSSSEVSTSTLYSNAPAPTDSNVDPTSDDDYVTFDPMERVIVTDQAMGARCAVAADFDGDGLLDIVSASSNDNAVSWFRNEGIDNTTGLPSFSIKQQITWSSLGSRIVTVADIDSDGDMDVIGASYYDMSLRWFENDGTGQFTPHLISSGVFEGQGVAVADLNNDGQPDVISASSGDNTIAVFRNVHRGQFCEIKQVVDDNAIGARTVIAADLNGDGWMDLASASKDDDTVAWYPNDGTGNFPTKLIVSAGNHSKGAYSLVAADIDQDGHLDLVVASNGNDRVTLWRNNGQGEFTQTVIFDNADFVLSVTAIDFDKDGDLDVASASFFDGYINWYENVDGKGNVWRNHTIYVGTQGHYVSNADLDGDGDADLIAVTHAENTVAVYMAHTRCDNPLEQDNDCCQVGTQWNGTMCIECPFGTYGDPNNAGSCLECPADACIIEGYTHLPATCSDTAIRCADASVDDSIATCVCPEHTMRDYETDICMECPEGQIRPNAEELQRLPHTIGNYSLWEQDQGVCYVQPLPTDYTTPLVATIAVVGTLLLLVLAYVLYKHRKLAVQNNLWKIKESDLIYGKPVVILGKGSFGEVQLADFRGTKVAVKSVRPNLLNKSAAVPNKNQDPEAALHDGGTMTKNSVTSSGYASSGFFSNAASNRSSSVFNSNRAANRQSIMGGGKRSVKAGTLLLKTTPIAGWFNSSDSGDLRDEFIKEIRMLSQLPEHRNIVCVMGAVTLDGEDPKLVMEYMERGSLYDLLKGDLPIGGQLLMNIMKDVTQGIRFLHNCDPQVVHSDLKSSNILIDDRWRAKISDFGWGTAGTPYWTAPEVLRGDTPYTPASDVWALGITMYEMYARKLPYAGNSSSSKEILEVIKKKNKRPRPPSTMGPKLEFMYKDCLGRKAHERPTLNELAARIERMSSSDFEYQKTKGSGNSGSDGPLLFPPHVSEALSKGHTVEPEIFDDATVCYVEIHDYASLSSMLTPMKLADMMHRLFDRLDVFAEQNGIFRVDMVGAGAWMGATNVVQHQPHDHLSTVAKFVLKAMQAASVTLIDEADPHKGYLQVRAAFATGSVEGRVVGVRKPRYTLSGPMVDAATFLANKKGEPGKIVCMEADRDALREKMPNLSFEIYSRVFVPGTGGANSLFWVGTSTY